VAALAEGWRSIPLQPLPEASIVRVEDAPGAVLELPLGDPWQDVVSVYRGIGHRHPVINGYSGYFPAHYELLRIALSAADPSVLEIMAARGLRHVVVLHDRDRDGVWRKYVAAYPGVTEVRTAGNQTLYALPGPAGASSPLGAPLPIASLTASVEATETPNALDGNPETRWSTGHPQVPGDTLLVDLGGVRSTAAVELALGPFHADYPRRLVIEGSGDQQAWATLWAGPTGGPAVAAALADPRRVPIRLAYQPCAARYLRLRQVGRDQEFYWTVADLRVLGPSAGR
jgi:hypothetical protein